MPLRVYLPNQNGGRGFVCLTNEGRIIITSKKGTDNLPTVSHRLWKIEHLMRLPYGVERRYRKSPWRVSKVEASLEFHTTNEAISPDLPRRISISIENLLQAWKELNQKSSELKHKLYFMRN
ncbi:MAG: hypothetical protein UU77_C0047G0002 [candidate division WWE3 bacterium GW2011_GWC1_41_7]|uniref:Uncharacterized protein n=4 Tax=Katanobacteria TaxID=422282 RepID=A0A0G0X379_UNCKA|nr:MAG: hypothetical protein UU72_C0001G0082 [candidate division WWE3 bacterium GW2011_GWB1_41_6]KKS19455.1 MAG: hypothetical protein UU77_C0047G0002 [candidate division WWE3 bacterium GW2011_GWC1_41_7]KKS22867.1 MAG: hypothetical protein UU80_C0001G0032 [candidate division WWE3 bacterium GW2011_GWA1_41_8]OGC57861.1 MAG: hypothetical protein A2976_01750 [candidate division WWE3 bacterium RIFCSPLOWO2_01_FULL_41_9]